MKCNKDCHWLHVPQATSFLQSNTWEQPECIIDYFSIFTSSIFVTSKNNGMATVRKFEICFERTLAFKNQYQVSHLRSKIFIWYKFRCTWSRLTLRLSTTFLMETPKFPSYPDIGSWNGCSDEALLRLMFLLLYAVAAVRLTIISASSAPRTWAC